MPPFSVETRQLPEFQLQARVASFDKDRGTFDIVWSRGATVRMPRFFSDDILEELPLGGDGVIVRMDAFRSGRAPFLRDHCQSTDSVVGVIERAAIEMLDGALAGTATVRLADTEGTRETREKIQQGILQNISVGFRVHAAEDITTDEDKLAGVRRIRATDWEPREASSVAVGADDGSHVRSEGGKDGPTPALYPCTVQTRSETTMPPKDETPAPQTPPQGAQGGGNETPAPADGQRSAPPATPPTPVPVAAPAAPAMDEKAVRTAERKRMADIGGLATRAGLASDNAAVVKAIEEGYTSERAALSFLNATADADAAETSDTAVTSGQRELAVEGFEQAAAIGLAARCDQTRAFTNPKDAFSVALEEKGNERSRDFARASLVDLCVDLLQSRNVRTRGMAKIDIVDAALRVPSYVGARGAPQTTSALAAIVLDVQNKFLRRAFQERPRSWAPLTRMRTATDFKALSTIGLSSAPDLLEVDSDGGPIEHGYLADVRQDYAVREFARIIELSRKLIVNDDLDALSRLPQSMGQAAERLASDLLWDQITSNPAMNETGNTLFHANHNNSGTAALVDESDVSVHRSNMGKQRGIDKTDSAGNVLEQGPLLNLVPRFLVVPPELETTADKITASLTPANISDANPFAAGGRTALTPIVEARLSASGIANGATTWFTATSPDQVDILELATLDGMATPRFMVAESIDYLGVKTRIEWPLGARIIDYRGLQRNNGTT